MKTPISILIIDDHALFGEGIAFILRKEPDMQVVAIAQNGLEGSKLIKKHKVDIVLLDLEMPLISGVETLKQLLTLQPDLRVLILTMSDDMEHLNECLHHGAYGYILKNASPAFLTQAIRQAMNNHKIFSQEIKNKFFDSTLDNKKIHPSSLEQSGLTEREIQVLFHLSQGNSNKLIAHCMHLSENTIKVHVQNILRKLNFTNRTQAANFANQHHIQKLFQEKSANTP
ncbi:response regulator [Pelistega ratti]|uniref:response regulator n=1 Tax=Pelistega ratti TaxID=2652177 RepID=UPI0013592871|nr:response regulator transcription factor [Pelistega ratti]